MIEKLQKYYCSPDGFSCIFGPTNEDIVDKLNEVIDVINLLLTKEASNAPTQEAADEM